MKGPGLAHLKKHQSRLRQTSKSFSLELPRAQLIKIFLFDYKRRRPKHGKEELFPPLLLLLLHLAAKNLTYFTIKMGDTQNLG